ncbi:hypothetical protein [Leptospira sp. 'Mane']|uniref:hypothetical protein n=1 Tax=Leptospira sp. 'Mane' TaxID=3387407 RepID=UPI00398B5948
MNELFKLFADLIQTTDRIAFESILSSYLKEKDKDTMEIVFEILLNEKKIKLPPAKIQTWISEFLQIPDWLMEECKTRVGSDSLNFALLFPEPKTKKDLKPKEWTEKHISPLVFAKTENVLKESFLSSCRLLPEKERILFLKMILPGKNISLPRETFVFLKQWKSNHDFISPFSSSPRPAQKTYLCRLVLGYAKKSNTAIGCYTDLGFLGKDNKNEMIKITTIVSPEISEMEENVLEKFITANLIQKFGPVLSVSAKLIFEISFLGIEISKRHKVGFSLVSPKIKKMLGEIDTASISDLAYFESIMKTEN